MKQKSEIFYYEIAVNVPLDKTFTYHSQTPIKIGSFVKAHFAGRKLNGVILKELSQAPEFKTKELIVEEPSFALNPKAIDWALWMSEYYCHPIGQVLQLFIPPLKYKIPKLKKQKATQSKKEKFIEPQALENDLIFSEEQEFTFKNILKTLNSFKVHLIHGVTGSGKTEIYLQLIKQVIANKKQALVLVPEISLTPQLEKRFKKRFGEDKVAIIHSQVTPRMRTDAWYDISLEKKPILIGARSALFSNLNHLGIIVLDEEHDTSFKQDEKFKYHGRDAAIKLAQSHKCPVILGSATPSIETYNKSLSNKFIYHELKKKVFDQAPPEVEILDLREAKVFNNEAFWYTETLHQKMSEHLNKNQQVALFLNRRGMAQTIQCIDCGHQIKCPNCDITLTLHRNQDTLCHYCGYFEKQKTKCPDCGSNKLVALGLGTEKVEEVIQKNFPNHVVVRADRDTIDSRDSMKDFIEMIENDEAQILIGTQMIAKGLDFPKLSFVGILLADIGLNIPDFRSNERIFQLISQVSGRAGRRKDLKSEVLIQTYNPEHPVFLKAVNYDYHGFAQNELKERQAFSYPPFSRLASLRVQSPEPSHLSAASEWVKQKALQLQKNYPEYQEIEILGPTAAPIQKIKNQFRNLFLLKSNNNLLIQKFYLQITHSKEGLPSKTKISLDVDPVNML